MSKMSKAIAVLGVVAGLGVAAMPLSSYAATSETKKAPINVEVLGSISISVTNVGTAEDFDAETSTLSLGEVMMNGRVVEKSVDVVLSSNGPRRVSLSIRDSDNTTGLMSGANSIPAITGNTLEQGDAGWGYKIGSETTWHGITTSDVKIIPDGTIAELVDTPIVSGKANELHTIVTFGAAANQSTPEGVYTGAVIFTVAPLD